MNRRTLRQLLGIGAFSTAAIVAVSAGGYLQDRDPDRAARARGLDEDTTLPLATGQRVTPLAIPGAVQQYLNPGLAAYPDFIAGMAVRSQLSPDGTTLAVLTAGQNSLYRPDGTVDTAASTQYVFLLQRRGDQPVAPGTHDCAETGERPRRAGVLTRREHAVRSRRQ